MADFLKGLKNYQTTITGILAILFAALANAFPEYAVVFDWLKEGFGILFVILVKDAGTGSTPVPLNLFKKQSGSGG